MRWTYHRAAFAVMYKPSRSRLPPVNYVITNRYSHCHPVFNVRLILVSYAESSSAGKSAPYTLLCLFCRVHG